MDSFKNPSNNVHVMTKNISRYSLSKGNQEIELKLHKNEIQDLWLKFYFWRQTTSSTIFPESVVSWRGARPDVRMHPLRCRVVRHPPPPPLLAWGGGESAAP
jgi:hypothetical protein